MSANSFRSVFMVASCAGAALGCYLVSLHVASERAALEQVETQIVLAERDIRLLQTEIGTRGRLAQLERWNVKVLALSAPSADQFVNGGFELARMVAPQRKIDLQAPVVLASAPAQGPKPQVQGAGSAASTEQQPEPRSNLMHNASFKRTLPPAARTVEAQPTAARPAQSAKAQPTASKPAASPGGAVKPASPIKPATTPAKPAEKKLASLTPKSAPKKTVDKTVPGAAKSVTKQPKLAKSDPLTPQPAPKATKTAKDSRQTP